MRRSATAIYFLIGLLPLLGITVPDTIVGALVLALLVAAALGLGYLSITARLPYSPEVALLAAVPYLMALLAGDASWQVAMVLPFAVLGEQMAARAASASAAQGGGQGDGADEGDEEHGEEDEAQ